MVRPWAIDPRGQTAGEPRVVPAVSLYALLSAPGQRMRASLDGMVYRYVYNGQRVVEETNDAGSVLARHTTASGSYYGPWLHMWRSGGVSRFPLFDSVGTARGLVDASATVTDSYVLDSFGTPTAAATATVNPYRFVGASGYITDPSGLLQLGARFYWPEIGRFIQQDPIGDGMNWYAYAGNNPVVWADPEGFDYTDVGGHIGYFGYGLQLNNPCPSADPPPWWDVFDIVRRVHPYVAGGWGLKAQATYSPGDQYPQKGLYVTGAAGYFGGATGSLGLQGQGNSWGAGGVWGGSAAITYVLW